MKRRQLSKHFNETTFLCTILLILCETQSFATIILSESFEFDPSESNYTVTGSFSDGSDDYFVRTSLDGAPTGLPAYDGMDGDYFWALEDTESSSNPFSESQLLFEPINIESISSIQFSLQVAAGSTNAFDATGDFLTVEYRIDNSTWDTGLAFRNDGTTYNAPLRQDLNGDGIGEGNIASLSFQNFQSNFINISGASMDIRIRGWVTAGSEAIAFDNLQVAIVPEPKATVLFFAILALIPLFLGLRKRSRE